MRTALLVLSLMPQLLVVGDFLLGVNPNNSEWYTLPEFLELVYSIMSIDLDPCSPVVPTVRCKKFYTAADDGLTKEWEGNVFLNPPYGRDISKWIDKLVSSYLFGRVSNCIALVPVKSDTRWFYELSEVCNYFVTLRGRIKFIHPDYGVRTSGTFPSGVFLLSSDPDMQRSFYDAFYEKGIIWSF